MKKEKSGLRIIPVKTGIFQKHGDLCEFITQYIDKMEEGKILAITSKIVSLSEGRTVKKGTIRKDELVRREADYDLGMAAYDCRLTIKHGLFIPSAGIDESNSSEEEFILYPEDPFSSARRIYEFLRRHYNIKKFGVLITDSHTLPLRRGVVGIALSYWGFQGVRNLIGRPDIFGRQLHMTQVDLADALAVAAVLVMGEADECCPLALIEHEQVLFTPETDTDKEELKMPMEQDLYYPLYKSRIP